MDPESSPESASEEGIKPRPKHTVQPSWAWGGLTVGLLGMFALWLGISMSDSAGREDTKGTITTPAASVTETSMPPPTMVALHTLDTYGVQHMAWSPDGSILATGYGNNVELWDGTRGEFLRRINARDVSRLAWSPDSRTLAIGANEGRTGTADQDDNDKKSFKLIDASTGKERTRLVGNHTSLVWSPDGKMAAIAFVVPGSHDGTIKLWDTATGQAVREIKVPETDPSSWASAGWIVNMGWSPDGNYLASLSVDKNIRLWDPHTGELKQTFGVAEAKGWHEVARDFEWSPDGSELAVVTGPSVELRDPATGKQIRTLPEGLAYSTPTIVYETDTRPFPAVVRTSEGGFTVTPWPTPTPSSPTPTGTPSPTPPYYSIDKEWGDIVAMAWSPDGETFATADGTTVKLWAPSTGTHKLTIKVDDVQQLVWSSNGARLATLSKDLSKQTIMLPDGSIEATPDGTLRLWDPRTGEEQGIFMADKVSDFILAPSGRAMLIRSGASATLWGEAMGRVLLDTPTAAVAMRTPSTASAPTPVCGAWSIMPVSGVSSNREELNSVGGVSPDDVWAVGYYSNSPLTESTYEVREARTLAMHWNGTAWMRVDSPNVGTGNNILYGIETLSTDDAWAVGHYTDSGGRQQALALRWDGKAWNQATLPELGDGGSRLRAVEAISSDDVWAVGSAGEYEVYTLVLHWDGHAWERITTPSPGIDLNGLSAVSALSRDDVWAAGRYVTRFKQMGAPQGNALLLHWDGSRWRVVSGSFEGTYTSGIALTSKYDGWLVGGWAGEGGGSSAVSRWDGDTWKPSTLPQFGNVDASGYRDVRNDELLAIDAVSSNDAWAVGSYAIDDPHDGSWKFHTLIEHWDGATWSVVPSPNAGTEGSALMAVEAISSGAVWAVGKQGPYKNPCALTMRFIPANCGAPAP